jgi:hypothetical protein
MYQKILFITKKSLHPEEAKKIVDSVIEEGFNYFICYAKTWTDIYIIQALKQYTGVIIELVCSDKNLKLSPDLQQMLYRGCNEFCLIENIARNEFEQLRYLQTRADRVYKI